MTQNCCNWRPAVFAIAIICLLAAPSIGQDERPQEDKPRVQTRDMTKLLGRFDKNSDGLLDQSELPDKFYRRLKASDANKDGKLSRDELKNVKMSGGPSNRRPGEVITGAAKGERYNDTLKAGDQAPDFTLSDPKGTRQVTLSKFREKRPVVLIFGSYT